jgi:hypothetical protein
MVCLENDSKRRLFPPSELWRGLLGGSIAVELPRAARAWLPPGSAFELALVVGHESDHATLPASIARLKAHDITFGGGGNFIAPDVAVRMPVGHDVYITLRLRDRIYFNELPLLAGSRATSDAVANDLLEGLANAPGADVVVRWHATAWAQPQLALFGEHLFPHNPSAREGDFFRATCGVALPGHFGELEPFASFDAGNGKGLLVNRREDRLSAGVRYAFF